MTTTHTNFARSRFNWLAALALAWPVLGLAQTAPTIKVGAIGPLSGSTADAGTEMLRGIQIAVEEFNRVGGYLGRHIELVVKDDESAPAAGVRESEALLQQGTVATIGFCNTGVALKAIPLFQKAQQPLIVPCSAGTPVTTQFPAPDSYIFRNSARDAIQAPFVVNDLIRRGWTRVAILADTTGYGEAGLKDVVAALKSHGLEPAYVGRFPTGVTDLSKQLGEARATGANAIFTYTVGPENAVIANGRSAMKWDVPIVGGWALSFPFFLEGAPQASEGTLVAQSFIAEPSNERRASFLANYARKFNQRMKVPMAAAQGYDAAYLLMYALLSIRDGKFSGPAIKAALENPRRTYYGVIATYERPFSPNDKDALTEDMLVMGKVRGGKITFAYPEDARRNLFVRRK
ncbi:MAG: ABC transporter substrate-binding protein [Hydrogenophaga sp.]|uniref:ABC transporter substrate-binding protein n=1 Tax=Hydrogenophaga sp. TaxID=1904254 RepID=UPI001D453561|nr:ABC transporter substrate-binding protein [Hydrogenophaga sp.]MBX3611057.1 ABC transporter substrate-binding protein [Hydrogenophaga sp.]